MLLFCQALWWGIAQLAAARNQVRIFAMRLRRFGSFLLIERGGRIERRVHLHLLTSLGENGARFVGDDGTIDEEVEAMLPLFGGRGLSLNDGDRYRPAVEAGLARAF